MDGILGTIGSEESSEGVWSLSLGFLGVGWSNEVSPLLNGVVGNQFHANDNVAGDKLLEVWEDFGVFWTVLGGFGGVLTSEKMEMWPCHETGLLPPPTPCQTSPSASTRM